MGYYAAKQKYLGTVRKTVNVSYPKSESGGSKSVVVEEPVYVDVYVESDPFERSVDGCDNSLHLLQAGIVAAEAAEKKSRIENSKRLGKSLDDGFFQVVNSNLTMQAKEEAANAKALVGALFSQQKELLKMKQRMEGDYNLIKSRYVKLFEDYDKELHNRIYALNKRTFRIVEESSKELMRPVSSILTAASLIGQKENLSLQTKITASRVKYFASLVISKVKTFIEGQNLLKGRLRNIVSGGCRKESFYAPVMCMQVSDKHTAFQFFSSELVNKNEKISLELEQRLMAPMMTWGDMKEEDKNRISESLSEQINATYADSGAGQESVCFDYEAMARKCPQGIKQIKDNVMKELKEVNFDNDIILNDNLVKGAILPKTVSELDRNVIIQGNTIIEGAVYAHKLEILQGEVDIRGAVYTKLELHVDSAAKGAVTFRKAVASSDSVASLTNGVRMYFLSDINAKSIKLNNAFIAGSLFADEAVLENCVILGGAFATKKLFLKNCIVGTFNAPSVAIQGDVHLLLPSAFSVEELRTVGEARMFNLSLADLGSIYTGNEQLPESGVIEMDIEKEELKSVLTADDNQVLMRTYSVVGKVLAADLIDTDKLNNHFLLTATSLGNQLLQTYSLHDEKNNTLIDIVPEKVADMFFDIISGKTTVQPLNGNFSIDEIVSKFS